MLCVISYDIADDARRRRVAETLKNFGVRVQFSVFECDLREEEIRELVSSLEFEISGMDSCRLYRVCERCRPELVILGKGQPYQEPGVVII